MRDESQKPGQRLIQATISGVFGGSDVRGGTRCGCRLELGGKMSREGKRFGGTRCVGRGGGASAVCVPADN